MFGIALAPLAVGAAQLGPLRPFANALVRSADGSLAIAMQGSCGTLGPLRPGATVQVRTDDGALAVCVEGEGSLDQLGINGDAPADVYLYVRQDGALAPTAQSPVMALFNQADDSTFALGGINTTFSTSEATGWGIMMLDTGEVTFGIGSTVLEMSNAAGEGFNFNHGAVFNGPGIGTFDGFPAMAHFSNVGDNSAWHQVFTDYANPSVPATMYLTSGSFLWDTGTHAFSFGTQGIEVNAANRGTGTATGYGLRAGRNSSGNGAAAYLRLQQRGGTQFFLWVDATGDLRIGSAAPTEDNTTVSDTSGTVVGSQS